MTRKPVLAIFGISFLISLVIGSYLTFVQNKSFLQLAEKPTEKPQILGISGGGSYRSSRPSQMYVYGGENSFGSGGVISMSSTDEPSLTISTYNVSGPAQVTLYRANIDTVLTYLVHDSENRQRNKSVDTGSLELVGTTEHNIQSSNDGNVLPLPIEGKGIWYVSIKLSSITVDGFIIRSDNGVLAKEGKDKFVFWGQNFESQRSVSGGDLRLYSLKDSIRELRSTSLGSDGIGESEIGADVDLAVYKKDDDISLLPLNLQYLNIGYGFSQFAKTVVRARTFIFTDRPLYQPGDTVNFKAIIRNDDDARYTVPGGSAKVTITTGNNENKFEKSFPISEDGSINGKYVLPDDAPVGGYNLTVDMGEKQDYAWGEYAQNSMYFNVQHYQKPESFINVDTAQIEYISGDNAKLAISGSYFSGQPLIGTDIKYKVTAVDYYEYSYYSDQVRSAAQSIDSFYGYWYGTQTIAEGVVTLDNNGTASVDVDTKQVESPGEYSSYTKGQSKIFVVEVTQADASLTPSYSKKNFIVYAGEYGIYQTSNSSSGRVNQKYNLPLKLAPYFRETNLAGIDLKAQIHRETWVKDDVQTQKYPTYHKEEEDLGEVNMTTGKDGATTMSFTPVKLGFYKIKVEGTDKLGNYIAKSFYAYISDRDFPLYSGTDAPQISLTLDQDKYEPDSTAKLSITSSIPDRDVFLTMERGRLDRTQVVHIDGKNKEVDIPLKSTDVPNMYLTVSGFNKYGLDEAEINVPVSALGKKINVTISPDNDKYGPSDNVSVELSTKTQDGSPIAAEVALWAVDKAIFELADTNLADIFGTFWSERGDTTYESHSLMGVLTQQAEGGGGCFVAGTQITLSDGTTKAIEDIKKGDTISTRASDNSSKVKAKVTGTHKAQVSGYMIVNDTLRITPDHILKVNNLWKMAGDIQVGDKLTSADGTDVDVESIAWQLGKFDVYNLEVEKYHTFIANGLWVHNQKGDGRTNFKDTAYWNPSIKTGNDGKASIKFKLPDNLTTWTMAAVASTKNSEVGQITKEIVVTKDLIVRPILPNIMRVGDELYLSALVQNFTDKDYEFKVQLTFDSGDVEKNTWENVKIASNDMEQLDWKITPSKINDEAKLSISAVANGNSSVSDSIEVKIPVRRFGFLEKTGETAIGDNDYSFELDDEIDLDKSEAKLSLASSLFGTLPTVMGYLVDYAYGCVEQTVSRLVPALIVAENPDLFGASVKDKNLDKIVDKNLARLLTMQRGDGGWTWWFTGKSDPYITAYAVEYIEKAEQLGYTINGDMLTRAKSYLSQNTGDTKTQLSEMDNDVLALAVIKNYKNGDRNANTNGLKELTSRAQSQGDGYFWEAGQKSRFGSIEASTGLALQAILVANGDKDIADKAVLYLTRSRKSDYWGNTYATARIITALVEYAKQSRDLTPNYSYTVAQNGKELSSGKVTSPQTILEDIKIPLDKLKNDKGDVSVSKTGDGNLYSTLIVKQFLTSPKQPSINRGISISKRFENTKGPEFDIGVGDTVNVYLEVSGLASNDKYGVITDELPSGMVPVNTGLKNEQSSWNIPEDYESGFNITDTEVTENGVVLSLYNIASETRTYSYKARVVSAGKFNVPPSTVSLMYSPEVYGRSATSQIELKKTYGTKSGELTNRLILPIKIILIVLGVLGLIGLGAFIIKKRKQKILEQVPPTEPMPPQTNEI